MRPRPRAAVWSRAVALVALAAEPLALAWETALAAARAKARVVVRMSERVGAGFAKAETEAEEAAWRADIRLRLVPRCTRRCVARQDTHPVAGMLGAKGSPPHMRSMRDAALRDSVLDPFHTACTACIWRAYSVLHQRA